MIERNRRNLTDLLDKVNEISALLNSIKLSERISAENFSKMEKLRGEAHRAVDLLIERKIDELKIHIDDFSTNFMRRRKDQMEEVRRCREKIVAAIETDRVEEKHLTELRFKIEQIERKIQENERRSIDVELERAFSPEISVRFVVKTGSSRKSSSPNSRSISSNSSSSTSSAPRMLEFSLKFVRQSGSVTEHRILVDGRSNVDQLVASFAKQFHRTVKTSVNKAFYLVYELKQGRVRRRLDGQLSVHTIFNKTDSLVIYETPFELTLKNLEEKRLLMCRFENGLPWNLRSTLPVLIEVPRSKCRSIEILDSIDQFLKENFRSIVWNRRIQVQFFSNKQKLDSTVLLSRYNKQIIDQEYLDDDSATFSINLLDSDLENEFRLEQNQSTPQ